MKKVLIISTVSRQFYLFEKANLAALDKLGYEIHGAANYSDKNERLDEINMVHHHIDIQRSPFSYRQLKAYFQLKKLMKEEKFDLVHCHAPMGGVIGRLAAKSVGIERVIYTAHGFHFYSGAPLMNWLLYYPVEKLLARYTDILVTINLEDYERAKKKFKAKKVVYINGIGIDLVKIEKQSSEISLDYTLPENSITLISVGELNANKNHEIVIRALANVKNSNIHYLIAGEGLLKAKLKMLAKELGLEEQIHLLGYRKDIPALCKISDIFIMPSYREGLSVALMEAMAQGLPIIASKIRGNTDLVDDNLGGNLIDPKSISMVNDAIIELTSDKELQHAYGMYNKEKIKQFSFFKILEKSMEIYN